MYTKKIFDDMPRFPQPAILTSNLFEEILKLLLITPEISNVKKILSEFIEPPTDDYIKAALSQLKYLNLIDSQQLTSYGKFIGNINIHPMILLSILAGIHLDCHNEIMAIFSMIDACKGNVLSIFIKPEVDNQDKFLNKISKQIKKDFYER